MQLRRERIPLIRILEILKHKERVGQMREIKETNCGQENKNTQRQNLRPVHVKMLTCLFYCSKELPKLTLCFSEWAFWSSWMGWSKTDIVHKNPSGLLLRDLENHEPFVKFYQSHFRLLRGNESLKKPSCLSCKHFLTRIQCSRKMKYVNIIKLESSMNAIYSMLRNEISTWKERKNYQPKK